MEGLLLDLTQSDIGSVGNDTVDPFLCQHSRCARSVNSVCVGKKAGTLGDF